MRVFIISDTHFGHEAIIRYCNRPFTSVEEMDQTMIKRWNETVSNNDIVIHLGDFALCGKDKTREIIQKLNGKKILIMGNHDNYSEQFYSDAGFHTVSRFPIIYDNFYMLSHAPLQLTETIGDNFIQVFGHMHDKGDECEIPGKSFCVSVEKTHYKPIELSSVKDILTHQLCTPKVLKAKQVMELLHITRPTLCKYLKEGKIKAYSQINGQYKYDANSIYKLLK